MPSIRDRLEGVWVEPEQLEDRWRDLGRLDPVVHARRLYGAGGVDDERHITVGRVVPAMLGDLGAPGVDDADLNAAEHVGVAGIEARTPKKFAAAFPA